MKSKDVFCPVCGKLVGKRVYEGTVNLGGFCADMCHEELDHRRASHVWWHKRGKSGTLCKSCARNVFPEGMRWRVAYKEHGKEMFVFGGVNGGVDFDSRHNAEAVCDKMNDKFGYYNYYYVVDCRI